MKNGTSTRAIDKAIQDFFTSKNSAAKVVDCCLEASVGSAELVAGRLLNEHDLEVAIKVTPNGVLVIAPDEITVEADDAIDAPDEPVIDAESASSEQAVNESEAEAEEDDDDSVNESEVEAEEDDDSVNESSGSNQTRR